MAHHNEHHKDVLKGTGEWLLTDPVFIRWKNDSASSLLWLHGILGSSKTKLISIVIGDTLIQHRAGKDTRPVYFYCSRSN